ncbi:RNA polymerase sigma factor [Sphingobacterium faecale]|uniref:RNA polymerase sigma-70 factor n=1 Tax=Sphingobacterium faecale TaxID=2803775 RepID=A0ABS1QYC2_9SPHI|nr:RNA polymerase sigma-70 factor [Sphingobacterium faecale]MBL1407175.1 RNA polymerase sigma-70 factor [Sphingobacterium faecale]
MHSDSNPIDFELLQRLKAGDHVAFEELYNQYSKKLYWKLKQMVKYPSEADELLQNLFVKVWEKREQIVIHQTFEGYLYRVAQHMAIDYFRSLDRQSRLQDEVSRTGAIIAENTEALLFAKETQQLLDEAVASLPEQRRRAFILCKLEGKSHQEAAEIMNISPNTVHNHLVKAVYTVRQHLLKSGRDITILALLIALFQRFS